MWFCKSPVLPGVSGTVGQVCIPAVASFVQLSDVEGLKGTHFDEQASTAPLPRPPPVLPSPRVPSWQPMLILAWKNYHATFSTCWRGKFARVDFWMAFQFHRLQDQLYPSPGKDLAIWLTVYYPMYGVATRLALVVESFWFWPSGHTMLSASLVTVASSVKLG